MPRSVSILRTAARTALRHPHATLHHIGAQPEQRLVAFRTNDRKRLVVHAPLVQDARQLLLRLLQLRPRLHALHLQQALLNELHPTGLYGKIGLRKRNLRLLRIAILRHQIARIAREHHVIDLTLGTFPGRYHLIDVNKMIGHRLSYVLASRLRLAYNIGEILPQAVVQQLLHIACTPALGIVYHAFRILKAREQSLYPLREY